LLEYLMRRAGEAVARADILDHVWDFAFDGDPNIVEVYIHQLRRKIDEPFRAPRHRDDAPRRLPVERDGG
jgi:two-component system, OmpR family, response regulator